MLPFVAKIKRKSDPSRMSEILVSTAAMYIERVYDETHILPFSFRNSNKTYVICCSGLDTSQYSDLAIIIKCRYQNF